MTDQLCAAGEFSAPQISRDTLAPRARHAVSHHAHYSAGQQQQQQKHNTIIYIIRVSETAVYNWKLDLCKRKKTATCGDESSHHAKPLFKEPVNENILYILIRWIYYHTLR